MKIDGVPIGNNRPGKVDGAQKSLDTDAVKRKTTVKEHGAEVESDRLEAAGFMVEADFEPRTERLESVMQRLGSDGYRDAETTVSIAEKLVDADIAAGITDDTTEVLPVRHDQIERIDSNVSSDYYDNDDVVRTIAERIAPILGLGALFDGSGG